MPEFINHYIEMWKNYFNFSGKTSVPGYWWAFLCNFVVSLLASMIGIGQIYSAIALIPGLAISVRRLNDAGKSWTWIFINFIPLVGTIIFIVMLCKPSVDSDTFVENNYIEQNNPAEF